MDKHFHRRNLPHLYFSEGIYFITYRLANSFPIYKQIAAYSKKWAFDEFAVEFEKYDFHLSKIYNNVKYLADPQIAEICIRTIHFPNKKDYNLICYCIMPNHIHLVFELLKGNKGISKIMQSIKRISAKKSNIILNRSGKFWQDESFDRWIRNEKELYYVIRYVLLNPVSAGLVGDWKDWEYTYCSKNYLIL